MTHEGPRPPRPPQLPARAARARPPASRARRAPTPIRARRPAGRRRRPPPSRRRAAAAAVAAEPACVSSAVRLERVRDVEQLRLAARRWRTARPPRRSGSRFARAATRWSRYSRAARTTWARLRRADRLQRVAEVLAGPGAHLDEHAGAGVVGDQVELRRSGCRQLRARMRRPCALQEAAASASARRPVARRGRSRRRPATSPAGRRRGSCCLLQTAGVSRPLGGMTRKSLHMQSFLQQKVPVTAATPQTKPLLQRCRGRCWCCGSRRRRSRCPWSTPPCRATWCRRSPPC